MSCSGGGCDFGEFQQARSRVGQLGVDEWAVEPVQLRRQIVGGCGRASRGWSGCPAQTAIRSGSNGHLPRTISDHPRRRRRGQRLHRAQRRPCGADGPQQHFLRQRPRQSVRIEPVVVLARGRCGVARADRRPKVAISRSVCRRSKPAGDEIVRSADRAAAGCVAGLVSRRSSTGSTRPRPNSDCHSRLTQALREVAVVLRRSASRPAAGGRRRSARRNRSPGIRGTAASPVAGWMTSPRRLELARPAAVEPGKDRRQAVIVVLRPAVERVVVAVGTAQPNRQQRSRRHARLRRGHRPRCDENSAGRRVRIAARR